MKNPIKKNCSLIILGVLVMLILVFRLIPNISKIVFNPVNQNMPEGISSSSYRKELEGAEWCASRPGYAEMMEDHLIKAKWDARAKGVDISKKVKEIYADGARSVIEVALTRALYGHKNSAKCELIRYEIFCLNAEIEPNKEKIAEVEKILQRN